MIMQEGWACDDCMQHAAAGKQLKVYIFVVSSPPSAFPSSAVLTVYDAAGDTQREWPEIASPIPLVVALLAHRGCE